MRITDGFRPRAGSLLTVLAGREVAIMAVPDKGILEARPRDSRLKAVILRRSKEDQSTGAQVQNRVESKRRSCANRYFLGLASQEAAQLESD